MKRDFSQALIFKFANDILKKLKFAHFLAIYRPIFPLEFVNFVFLMRIFTLDLFKTPWLYWGLYPGPLHESNAPAVAPGGVGPVLSR